MVYVDPSDVRFTQRSIANHFSDAYEAFSLEEAQDRIERGWMRASDFPPIQVYRDENGTLWSQNNRRLWVFRKAAITRVEVKLFVNPFFRLPPSGAQREEMARPQYFPLLRGSRR